MKVNATIPMQDKDIMHDALTSQKFMTGNYSTYANECATPDLRNEMLNILQEEHTIQAEVFAEMQNRGWYPTTAAPKKDIQQAKKKLTEE